MLEAILAFFRSLFGTAPYATKVTLDPPQDAEEPAGAVLIKHYEGCAKRLPDGTIVPYMDPNDGPTIGWGNRFWEDGTPVKMIDTPITQARADRLFDFWYRKFREDVEDILPVGARKRETEAFTSFAYNIGLPAFRNTSSALRYYQAGDLSRAGDAMELWIKDDGKVLLGLQRRRRAEHLVFDGMPVRDAIKQAEKDFPK